MYARVIANGTNMGVYEGDDEDAVLDAYARDAGYNDYADLLHTVPGASPDDVELQRVGPPCPTCEGDGVVPPDDPYEAGWDRCPDCGGSGRVQE